MFFLQESSDGKNWKPVKQSDNLTVMIYELGGYRDASYVTGDPERYRVIDGNGNVIAEQDDPSVL